MRVVPQKIYNNNILNYGRILRGAIGKDLAKLRQERRLTKEQLGQVLCVSAGTISNYEKGVHLPDADKLIMLADYFHVSTDYLLGRTRIQETQTDFQRRF